MDEELFVLLLIFVIPLIVGIGIGTIVAGGSYDNKIILSQETAQDICKNLGNYSVNYLVNDTAGKLVCIAPGFDNTQNIKFEKGDN